ncbi:MAG: hypothetical protein ACRDRX_09075 [Pseudonocardiaceae bacterium]
MDVLLAMKAAVRRWYIAGPMLLLTMVVSAFSFLNSASAWQTSGTLLILPPLAPTSTATTDSGGTRLQAALLADNLNSDVVQASLKANGATGIFQAKSSTELPLVSVAVEGNSADVAANTLKIVLDSGDAVMADLQQRIGTNKADFYRSVRSVADSSPKFSASSRLVGAIGIGVGGTALSVLLAAVVDGLLTRRRQNDPAPDDDPAPEETESLDHPLPVGTHNGALPEQAMNGHAPTTNNQPETPEQPTWTPPPQPTGSPTSEPTQDTRQQSR